MFLVLLVLPALVAVQRDVARQMTAMRRATTAPLRGFRSGFILLWALVLAWCAATLGWVVWSGQLLAPLAGLAGSAARAAPMTAALALFIAGVAFLCFTAYVVFALLLRRQAQTAV